MKASEVDGPLVGGPALSVEFLGEAYQPSDELVFGRTAELSLDDNTFLHRRAGRFVLRPTGWWLENLGARLRLTMVSNDGTVIDLRPGSANPLVGPAGVVSLQAGTTRYEMAYHLAAPAADEVGDGVFGDGVDEGADTLTMGPPLTPREIDFAVVLARGRLTGRLGPLPSHGDIAQVWGVSHKTVDNTFQRLRSKLRSSRATSVTSAETLVEYVVTQGLVTMEDLEWAHLDDPTGPRSAAERRP
ncbi:MAG: helix-turn-helix transcriptional regulator [Acidimicrobiales bacterium]